MTLTTRSWPGLAAAAIAVAVAVLTASILVAEGEGDPMWAPLLIGTAAVAAGTGSAVDRPPLALALLWSATAVLTGLGVLAIFSVGLLLLVAAAFAFAGTVATAVAVKRPWLIPAIVLSMPASGLAAVGLYVGIAA